MSKISTIDEFDATLGEIIHELTVSRDRLDVLKDEVEELISNCSDALDSLEYAREALSRTL
jgi:hypothetical protein